MEETNSLFIFFPVHQQFTNRKPDEQRCFGFNKLSSGSLICLYIRYLGKQCCTQKLFIKRKPGLTLCVKVGGVNL